MSYSAVLDEQIAYYRARATEYDEWFYRVGRYDRGESGNAEWFSEISIIKQTLLSLPKQNRVLELAGGTGIWTLELLNITRDTLTVIDASPEMIAINRAKVVLGGYRCCESPDTCTTHDSETQPANNLQCESLSDGPTVGSTPYDSLSGGQTVSISTSTTITTSTHPPMPQPFTSQTDILIPSLPSVTYYQTDIFKWQPTHQHDMVFFAFWLSHVPPNYLDLFLSTVSNALKPGGWLFMIDSRKTSHSTACDHLLPSDDVVTLERKLNDGRTFEIVKVFYDREMIEQSLLKVGIQAKAQYTNQFFVYAFGTKLG